MAEMGDSPNPMDDLAREMRAEIAAWRAQVEEDGQVLNGEPHPLLAEIRAHEVELARIFRASN